jgi:HAD superfamily hydrolase (TIGR01549 family)
MFKLVIVDLIGILTQNENEYFLLKKILNFKGTVQSLKAYMGDSYNNLLIGKISERTFWNNLLKKVTSKKKLENIKKEFLESFNPIFNAELLSKARQNFKFALCSNFYYPWYDLIKKENNIDFDYESISSKVKMKKDNKEMYLGAMLKFDLIPSECLVVSDEISDLNLAKDLGMKTLFIAGKSKEFKKADYFYEKFDDFLKILI